MKRKETGVTGEQAAARYLKRTGYRILDQNWRNGRAEIDLVAERKNVLVFVEVKSQFKWGKIPPECSLDRRQMERITAAATRYMEIHNHPGYIRFDLITVEIRNRRDQRVKHFKDAFFPGLEHLEDEWFLE